MKGPLKYTVPWHPMVQHNHEEGELNGAAIQRMQFIQAVVEDCYPCVFTIEALAQMLADEAGDPIGVAMGCVYCAYDLGMVGGVRPDDPVLAVTSAEVFRA